MGKINKDDQVLIMVIVICQMAPLYFPKLIQINYDSMLRMINVKTYQFKTHCKGEVIALKLQISFCQDSW